MKRLLECAVCIERFTDPRRLNCLHNFCLQCIEGLVQQNQIKCPLCRTTTHVPKKGITSLKKDAMVASLLAIALQDEEDQTKHKACGVCEEVAQLLTFCKKCRFYLCKICSRTHARFFECAAADLVTIKVMEQQTQLKMKVQENIMALQNDCGSFTNRSRDFEQKRKAIKQEIQNHVDDVVSGIEVKKVELFDKVDTFFDGKLDDIQQHKDGIRNKMSSLSALTEDLNQMNVEAGSTDDIDTRLRH